MENPLAAIKTHKEADAFMAEHGACRVYLFKDQSRGGAQHAHIIRFRRSQGFFTNPWLVEMESEMAHNSAQATAPRSKWYIIPTYVFNNGLREVEEKDSHDWVGLKVDLWVHSYFPKEKPLKCELTEMINPGYWLVTPINESIVAIYASRLETQALTPQSKWYIYPTEFPPQTPSEISARRLGRIFLGGR